MSEKTINIGVCAVEAYISKSILPTYVRCSRAWSHITSPCHHITTSPHHHIITSSHHHVTTSPHHHITTSPHHITTSSHHHITISPHHHVTMSANHHITTSHYHFITSPTFSHHHVTTSPHHHTHTHTYTHTHTHTHTQHLLAPACPSLARREEEGEGGVGEDGEAVIEGSGLLAETMTKVDRSFRSRLMQLSSSAEDLGYQYFVEKVWSSVLCAIRVIM